MDFSVKNMKYVDGWIQKEGNLLLNDQILPKGNLFDLISESDTNEQFKNIISKMKNLVSGVVETKRNYCLDNRITLHADLSGRLLAFSPFFTCCDGIASSESEGLLDETNQPLKAFWIDFLVDLDSVNSERLWDLQDLNSVILVSWIPEKHIEVIDHAISENGDDSLYWLS